MRSHVPLRPGKGRLAALVAALLIGLLGAEAGTATAAPAPSPATVPATAPAAQQQQTFGIQPASATAPDGRSAYTYIATPGAQVKDHVAVWNYGDQPLSLTLYAADAFNTDTGGYDLLPAAKKSSDVGAWVHLATGTVELPPRSRQIVPFTFAVPADAAPGDHAGGIVLALRRQTVDAKGNAIAVDQRVGTRIHLRVPGALRPQLTIVAVRTVYHGTLNPFDDGYTTTSYTVRNTGNIRLAGRQAVRVRNALGSVVTAKGPAALTELLPGNTATYSVRVSGVYPALWQTTSITIDPLALPGDTDPALPSATHNLKYATIPWTVLAVLLVLLIVGSIWYLGRRQRRRGNVYGPGGGGTRPPGQPFPQPPVPLAPTAPPPAAAPVAPPVTGSPTTIPVPVAVPVPAVGAATAPVPVPAGPPAAGAETPPAAGAAPEPEPESAPVPRTDLGKNVTAVLSALLLGGLAVAGLAAGAPRAYADPTPAASAAGSSAPGTLAFDYGSGHADDSIDVLTSGPCPHPTDSVMATIAGSGFPKGGSVLVGLSPASIYDVAANGGLVVPLSNTLSDIAHQNGVTALHGRYVVDVFCKGRFLPAHFRDFPGALTFAVDGTWKAEGKPATALIHGSSGTPAPVQPVTPSLPTPNPAPAAEASGSGGIPSDSIAAMVGGGGLLALIGGSYLRRQRAKVKAIRSAAPAAPDASASAPAPAPAPAKEKAAKR